MHINKSCKNLRVSRSLLTSPIVSLTAILAVVLAALLSAPGKLRSAALNITGESGRRLVRGLKPGRQGYRSVAVVGRKQDIAEQVAHALRRDGLIRRDIDTKVDGGQALLDTLKAIAARLPRLTF